MNKKKCDPFWANIYIAGPVPMIEQVCREFCEQGLCVTVTPTNYIYTMGEESGAIVGLINYPRFPKTNAVILNDAIALGHEIMEQCCQGSFTVMTPKETHFFSRRKDDEKSKK